MIHCTRCKRKNEIINNQVRINKNGRLMISGKCSVCDKVNNSFLPKSYLEKLVDGDREKLKSGGMLDALIPLAMMASTTDTISPEEEVKTGEGLYLGGSMIFDADERRLISTVEAIANKRGLGLILANGDGLFLSGSGLYSTEHLFNLRSKIKKGGVIGIDDIIAIIIAIITLVTTIVELIKQREAFKEAEEERKRRDAEAKRAENDQKLYELKLMLQSYNETLGELATEANMEVKDFIIQQLKDNESKVSKMKATILAKAKEFQMTPPDFIDYCNEIAGQYEWWNVGTLLDVMKKELTNPGTIQNSAP